MSTYKHKRHSDLLTHAILCIIIILCNIPARAHMLQCTSQIHSRSFLISIQVLAACLTKIFVFVDLLIISRHVPYSIRQSSSNYTIYFNPSVLPPLSGHFSPQSGPVQLLAACPANHFSGFAFISCPQPTPD